MTKSISAKEFDLRAEKGEELDEFFDYDSAKVVDPEPRDILISLPEWAVDVADQEATRRNMSRRAVLNMWITDKADETRQKASALAQAI